MRVMCIEQDSWLGLEKSRSALWEQWQKTAAPTVPHQPNNDLYFPNELIWIIWNGISPNNLNKVKIQRQSWISTKKLNYIVKVMNLEKFLSTLYINCHFLQEVLIHFYKNGIQYIFLEITDIINDFWTMCNLTYVIYFIM